MAIALNERNIPHEKCLVDLQNKPENFTSTYARASPARAKVPVLEVGDDVLVESMVILEYLDRESAADPIVRASERLLAAELPKSFGYISVLKEEEGSEAEAKAIESLIESLQSADALLRTHARGDGPFVGDAFGHVEEAAAPFACRLLVSLRDHLSGAAAHFAPHGLQRGHHFLVMALGEHAERGQNECHRDQTDNERRGAVGEGRHVGATNAVPVFAEAPFFATRAQDSASTVGALERIGGRHECRVRVRGRLAGFGAQAFEHFRGRGKPVFGRSGDERRGRPEPRQRRDDAITTRNAFAWAL